MGCIKFGYENNFLNIVIFFFNLLKDVYLYLKIVKIIEEFVESFFFVLMRLFKWNIYFV